MKKEWKDCAAIGGGILLAAAGFLLLRRIPGAEGFFRALPYVLIGFGCGMFGHGMGEFTAGRAMKKDPELAKQMEIEAKDERNIMIANYAKGKAFDLMTFVFGALMVSFALMGVDLAAVLLLVAAYLFVEGSAVWYRVHFDKEM